MIDPAKLESKVATLSDQDLRTYYDKNKAKYNVPEKRKSRYAFVDMVKFRTELKADDDELRNYYDEHSEEYRLPEQVTAQHILFKTEGKTPEQVEAIRKKATDVLARAKKGEDFSKLAKEFSEDPSAKRGGDLGTFGRRSRDRCPSSSRLRSHLGVGAISDLVTTPVRFSHHQGNCQAGIAPENLRGDQGSDRVPASSSTRLARKPKQSAEQIALELVTDKDHQCRRCQEWRHGEGNGSARAEPRRSRNSAMPWSIRRRSFRWRRISSVSPMEVQNGYAVPQVVQIEAGASGVILRKRRPKSPPTRKPKRRGKWRPRTPTRSGNRSRRAKAISPRWRNLLAPK